MPAGQDPDSEERVQIVRVLLGPPVRLAPQEGARGGARAADVALRVGLVRPQALADLPATRIYRVHGDDDVLAAELVRVQLESDRGEASKALRGQDEARAGHVEPVDEAKAKLRRVDQGVTRPGQGQRYPVREEPPLDLWAVNVRIAAVHLPVLGLEDDHDAWQIDAGEGNARELEVHSLLLLAACVAVACLRCHGVELLAKTHEAATERIRNGGLHPHRERQGPCECQQVGHELVHLGDARMPPSDLEPPDFRNGSS
mmetsp:Transcript_33525/g.75989  ORF Transcript_33525/g.75989 Transcript_33525/m.75989 type:complete len:258 (-) Transcript_33525:2-775(-)